MTYRPEVDGLRAIAVVPVILFHAGLGWASGGFVGVDIFFVISGYLITSIILTEVEAGRFSLVTFYERRARRILPPLYFVMAVCVPFAWLWMLPDDLENFGQSLVATTLFSNNVLLWLTSGYFQLENEFKPLFHTWSLGVEEQFYVGFPILVLLLWKRKTHYLAAALITFAALSLACAHWASRNAPIFNYLFLFSRIWELAIGALVAIYHVRAGIPCSRPSLQGEALNFMGIALILVSVFAFDKTTPFPSLVALAPTIGTALLLHFSSPETVIGRALGHRVLVGLGLVSYSAYLWHQPLFAFVRLRSLHEPNQWELILLGIASFALAYFTWRHIERPFRDRTLMGRRTIFLVSLTTGIMLGGVGLALHVTSGFLSRWPELTAETSIYGRKQNAAYNQRANEFLDVPFSDSAKVRVLVLGNSYARDFINAGLEVGYFKKGALSYSLDIPTCITDTAAIASDLRKRIASSTYLIFGSPSVSLGCWRNDVKKLKDLGATKIIVIGTKNFGWNMNAVMLLAPEKRYSYRADVLPSILLDNRTFRDALTSEYYVDVLSMISDLEGRVPVFTENKRLISQDRSHLTRDGAAFVGKKLFEHPLLRPLREEH